MSSEEMTTYLEEESLLEEEESTSQQMQEDEDDAQSETEAVDTGAADDGEDEDDDFDDDFEDEEEEEEEEEEEATLAPSVYRPRDPRSRVRPRQAGNDVTYEDLHYKNIEILSRFIDNRGRILSRRKTKISAKMQRRLTTAIKRARFLALLPYTAEHIRTGRKR